MHTNQTMKTLIHLHTNYSYDSDIPVEALADFVLREEIDCIAVTDHDTIEGAVRLQAMTDCRVIVGEEVSTRDGHLIGLFLTRHVEPGMTAMDTARAIHDQGGLVLVPHPFIRTFGCALKKKTVEIAELIDAVEIFNSQNLSPLADWQAIRFAKERELPMFVGSDSHSVTSIAPAYQLMPAFENPAEFLISLRSAAFTRRRHPVSYFIVAAYRIARHYASRAISALSRKKTSPVFVTREG